MTRALLLATFPMLCALAGCSKDFADPGDEDCVDDDGDFYCGSVDCDDANAGINPGAEVCAELGRLLVGLGEPKVASAYYREGLAASTSGLPELPMPDKIVSNHHLLERSTA